MAKRGHDETIKGKAVTEPAFSPFLKMPHIEAGMRVGLFGGSFNPPHYGHLLVAQTALCKLQLDQIWWMVTPGNPLKDHRMLQPLETRLALVQKLTRHPRMKVTAFEAAHHFNYSAATIDYILKHHPKTHFVWVMGADSLASFHHWYHWRHIVEMLPIAIIDRPQARMAALSSHMAQTYWRNRLNEKDARILPLLKPPAWVYLHGPRSDLSSTQLRFAK